MSGANRLAAETSPYLRQHAGNPVDWWPWCDEAFAEARRRDVPVLLSVGYSSCHWCHVMAEESFEDRATAALLNERFVCVKVDREERPDVDALYMEAVQAISGHGGWPMTAFLTPAGEVFFAGTYYPPEPHHGLPSFRQVLHAVSEAWRGDERRQLLDHAGRVTEALSRSAALAPGPEVPGRDALRTAADGLLARLDQRWGGFGPPPKFPSPMALEHLLRHHAATGDPRALHAATLTLDHMAAGGIYDHVGGGFARYSTDERWLVPHFEKMLYDNAQLIQVYTHAWQLTGDDRYRQVVEEVVAYVRRDLGQPGGGFASAEDADSGGVEGGFYLWTLDELRAVLGPLADAAARWWGAGPEGVLEGANVLHRPDPAVLARPPEIDEARRRLYEHRSRRARPGLDDKVLTEWNALAVAALAEAGAAFDRADWVAAAVAAAEFLISSLRRADGRWLRSWQRDGGARHLAYAEDHAALVDAFTRLGEASGQARWYDEALRTADALLELFWDPEGGGVFTTGSDAPALLVRRKDVIDTATPSANGTAALALLRLAALSGRRDLEDRAAAILRLVGPDLARHPQAFGRLLCALDLHTAGASEVVVVGDRPDLVREVQRRYLPRAVLSWGQPLASPLWEGREAGAAYLCHRHACRQPATTVAELAAQLEGVARPTG